MKEEFKVIKMHGMVHRQTVSDEDEQLFLQHHPLPLPMGDEIQLNKHLWTGGAEEENWCNQWQWMGAIGTVAARCDLEGAEDHGTSGCDYDLPPDQ